MLLKTKNTGQPVFFVLQVTLPVGCADKPFPAALLCPLNSEVNSSGPL